MAYQKWMVTFGPNPKASVKVNSNPTTVFGETVQRNRKAAIYPKKRRRRRRKEITKKKIIWLFLKPTIQWHYWQCLCVIWAIIVHKLAKFHANYRKSEVVRMPTIKQSRIKRIGNELWRWLCGLNHKCTPSFSQLF